jgi:hypothetical protein
MRLFPPCWITADTCKHFSHLDTAGEVELQKGFRYAADVSSRPDESPGDAEMVPPFFLAWIEERSEFEALRINGSNVRTFETVAIKASERQIVDRGLTSVFGGYDVIGFVREEGLCFR